MSNHFKDYEEYSGTRPSLHKRFGGKDYFWAGKFKEKRRGPLAHYMAVANQMGYHYRVERIKEVSNLTFNVSVRYNLWCRRK